MDLTQLTVTMQIHPDYSTVSACHTERLATHQGRTDGHSCMVDDLISALASDLNDGKRPGGLTTVP